MKKKIQQFEGVKILRRNEKLRADCLYILNSEAVALNMYFQSRSDVVRAHDMFRKHLQPYMDFIDYLITPNGWMAIVMTKSEDEIIYNADRNCGSNKMREAIENRDTGVILSECIRYSISGIATGHNDKNERKGTLVSRNFSRFILEDVECAERVMRSMKQEQIDLCWQKDRYRPCLKEYEGLKGFMEDGDIFLCTKRHDSYDFGGIKTVCLRIIDCKINVLREIIKTTFEHYFPSSQTKKTVIQT